MIIKIKLIQLFLINNINNKIHLVINFKDKISPHLKLLINTINKITNFKNTPNLPSFKCTSDLISHPKLFSKFITSTNKISIS
jgi:hypothetical protein